MLNIAFLSQVLNTMEEHIAVLDESGKIVYVNQAWVEFGNCNQAKLQTQDAWIGIDYLEVCRKSATNGDETAKDVFKAVSDQLAERVKTFNTEYPCHSPKQQRWFTVRTSVMHHENERYIVISHQDITLRKMTELEIEALSRTDPLTGLANRRHFAELMTSEWNRCTRFHQPFSLIILDLDFFKQLNDKLGHLEGDHCLEKIGHSLQHYAKRANDICARYGGEEFALAYGGLDVVATLHIAMRLQSHINALQIKNPASPHHGILTFSAGISTMYPTPGDNITDIIALADQQLYRAKQSGRNCIAYQINDELKLKSNPLHPVKK
ncbi:sensor domain-containing diguanylate cyclase [Thaumasiovibrio subtropicus]|uniref:sensor domain-containing diguanylate cyclase n=1 Tax=Thaumasiovibrio subtropicus TaxID=1891207 RepID=UPI000B3646B2|nr:sensor domain-containing diguanylate cyclase [Thaumasiovibrio subtropicus]